MSIPHTENTAHIRNPNVQLTCKGKKAKGATITEAAPTVQQKRTLGLVILRGETIVSVTVEGPPPVEGEDKTGLMAGPGKGVPAGRGMPLGGPGAFLSFIEHFVR